MRERATIQRHPPERGARGTTAAPAGQCCCCCCCCLHTIGGVIGALTARSRPIETEPIPTATVGKPQLAPKHSATGLYWAVVLVLAGFAATWNLFIEQHPDTGESVLIIALCLPVVQLVASAVTLALIALSNAPGKEHRLAHLGKISARAFLGALIGLVVMLPMLSMCK